MIEKPKRPKKPDIQERQPPRTLQELINRYDLDNTKIYDFLDGLVDLLNTREETVDTDISNLNNSVTNLSNNKVNRSGDTLTGELQFNNKNDYGAIRKARTIDNVDYSLSLGVGVNKSARLEIYSGNTTYGQLDVGSDGRIWNGKTNQNFPEVAYCAWSPAITFTMKGGHALVMLNNTDCLMLWVGGNYPSQSVNVVRLYGSEAQVIFNAQNQTITIKFANNRNFTCTAFIGRG